MELTKIYCNIHKKNPLTFIKSLDGHNCYTCSMCNNERLNNV
jgi:hypothetical protein